ncbi:hypothetical protein QYE76_050758 [Lolium multiflorum]|uniref:Uncharacterized protein n=1 Tax=Lolium multiflorum TaxID=4521 RepID=A0AAD8SRH9_LOLMU|nr:hypothetical protein QYE76_050758 [Lolium multiflorum]
MPRPRPWPRSRPGSGGGGGTPSIESTRGRRGFPWRRSMGGDVAPVEEVRHHGLLGWGLRLSVDTHGGFGGAVAASAPGNGSAAVHMIRVAVLFLGDPAGGIGGVRAANLALFLVAVLGFLACEDEDLPEVGLL